MDYWDFFTAIWTTPEMAMIGTVLLAILILAVIIFTMVAGFGAISADEAPLALRIPVAIAFWSLGAIVLTFSIPLVFMLVTDINGRL